MDIDIDNNILKGRSALSSYISSRESYIYLAVSSLPYYERIEIQNKNLNKNKQDIIKEISLSYTIINNQDSLHIRQVTNNSSDVDTQYVINKTPALNNMPTP